MSQADVARELGISQTAYSAIENGTNRMYAEYLPGIASALQISIGDLFAETDPKIGPLNKEEKSLISYFRKIPADDDGKRQALLEMAEVLGK